MGFVKKTLALRDKVRDYINDLENRISNSFAQTDEIIKLQNVAPIVGAIEPNPNYLRGRDGIVLTSDARGPGGYFFIQTFEYGNTGNMFQIAMGYTSDKNGRFYTRTRFGSSGIAYHDGWGAWVEK